MVGDDRVRHCGQCNLDVYDARNLSLVELRELVTRSTNTRGRLCMRLHRRADGTVLTRDCPVGVRRFYARLSGLAALLLGALGLPRARTAFTEPWGTTPTMGIIAMPARDPSDGDREPSDVDFPQRPPVEVVPAAERFARITTELRRLSKVDRAALDRLAPALDGLVSAAVRERWPRTGDAYNLRARILYYAIYVPDAAGELPFVARHDRLAAVHRDLQLARTAYAAPTAATELHHRLHEWMPEHREPGRYVARATGREPPREIHPGNVAHAIADLEVFVTEAYRRAGQVDPPR